ncbi:MAG: ABC transporter permease [Bacillota bacterium]
MKKLDLRLFRMIKNSKGQFISVVVVVVLALCIYVAYSMTALNLDNTIHSYYEMTNFQDIQAQLVKIPRSAVDQLQDIQGIEEIQGRISFDVPLRVEDDSEKVNVRLISLPDAKEQINDLYILEGKNVTAGSKDVVVLEQFAKARNIRVGDKISPYIQGRSHQMNVIGIAASSEYVYLMENEQALLPAPEKFGVLFVSEEFAQSTFGYRDSYNEIVFTMKDDKQINKVADELEERLDKYGLKRVIEREDQLSHKMLSEEINQLKKMATAVPVLFLAVASVIISIILSRTVKNDRIVIGVLKALGYSNLSILSHYIKYALSIGFIGTTFGVILGILLSGAFAKMYIQFYNIPFLKMDIYYIYIYYAYILTTSFCIGSGVLGARSVLGIMPAESMRPEAPKTGKRIFLEGFHWLWNQVPFSWKMVIRNIFRNKKRFAFLVLGIALTYGMNIVSLFLGNSFTAMFDIHYGKFQRMDYSIDFARPMNRNVLTEIKQLVEVEEMAPKLEYPFELQNGWRKKVVSIVGIPEKTEFYHFEEAKGGGIALPKEGILLSEGLARGLHVKKGDTIQIKNFIPGKDDVSIEVKGVIKQYLGMNAYMNIREMDYLLAEKGMITGVLVNSHDTVQAKMKNVKEISAILSVEDMKSTFLQYLDSIIYSTGVMMLFGGILGFAIVYNASVMSISERIMEFSSLRVLGFEKNEIFRMVTRENFLMTCIAIFFGIPLGLWMSTGLAESFNTDMYTIPVILTPKSYGIGLLATVLFVFIAQLATRRKIYRLNFLDSLKNRVS